MQVNSLNVAGVFANGGNIFYILPYFQREYAWTKDNWKTLLTDVYSIYDAYTAGQQVEHFMGSLVVINDGVRNGIIPAFKLVDGQQRLITIALLLRAVQCLTEQTHPQVAQNIQGMLVNMLENDPLTHFKILPTKKYGDREAYQAIIKGQAVPDHVESKIPEAYDYLYKELEYKVNQKQLDPTQLFIAILNALQVVFINLNQNERPYEIFESLNAKAKPLSQADLVRNYVAMKLPEDQQEIVFENDWSRIESLLQEKRSVGRSRLGELTGFLRHYLAIHSGSLCNERDVYPRFRDRIEQNFKSHQAFVGEIATLKRFAEYYDFLLRPENEPNIDIRQQLIRLNTLEISTAYPFLLNMYEAMHQDKLSQVDFLKGLQCLENYMVRRYLAGEPTNYLNKMFPTLWRETDLSQFTTSLAKALATKNYPSDNRIKQVIYNQVLYDRSEPTRRKTCLILETINQFLSRGTGGHTVLSAEPTIEHVMPQTLSKAWKDELGDQWEQVYRDYLHTLGNLTLVTQDWNSTLSNAEFKDKKEKLYQHALLLNSSYFSIDIPKWDETAIRVRTHFLTEQILHIWPSIGDVPPPPPAGTKPQAVIFLGETFPVQTWRDVAYYTAEAISQVSDNFDTIATQMPSYFSKEEFKGTCRQLSNGWWLYVNLSSMSVRGLCQRLLDSANISDEDWQLEEE